MSSNSLDRPNIVFILTDDQGAWTLGSASNREIRTPNLDRLAETGVRFENYFCTCPVCSPARATIMTGCIPSQHGVHDFIRIRQGKNPVHGKGNNGRAIEYLEGQTGYTDVLAESGYTCGIVGKWHMGDECRRQRGFAHWRVSATGNGPYYRMPLVREDNPEPVWNTDYYTHVVTDGAVELLNEYADGDAAGALANAAARHPPQSIHSVDQGARQGTGRTFLASLVDGPEVRRGARHPLRMFARSLRGGVYACSGSLSGRANLAYRA